MTTEQAPLWAIARGVAAGVIGMAAMTAAQEVASKLQSSGGGGRQDEEPQGPQDPWERAAGPAEVARRISERVQSR